jgi:tRNA dimethylallyltransferase
MDPVRANEIDRHNPVRLIRAIEIAAQLSQRKPQGDALGNRRAKWDAFNFVWIGLEIGKPLLQKKITARLHTRIRGGMIHEVKSLHEKGVSWRRLEALGLEYRYVAAFLQKKITKKEMEAKLEIRIWQYAKRQLTYWRRNKDIQWMPARKVLSKKFLTSLKFV